MLSDINQSKKENYCVVLIVVSSTVAKRWCRSQEKGKTKFLINGLQTGNLSGKCFLTMNVLNAKELFIMAEVVKGIPAFIIYFTIEYFNYVKMQ